jgi:predicted nuclease of predicted toxin-antitoxin system
MPQKLRLYLDQCLRLEVAEALRSEGYDVLRASEVGQARADDFEVLQRANSERRILITFDEHFGDWVVLPLREHSGVIRIKVNPATPANAINLVVPFLKGRSQAQFQNKLVILSPKRARWVSTSRGAKPSD